MAKITRTQQRRLVASSLAFILTAAMMMMMPTTTDARGGGHGGHAISILGSPRHHINPRVGFPFAVARVPFSSHHAFSQRRVASRRTRASGTDFVGFAANDVWFDNGGAAPTILFTQNPPITQEIAAPRMAAVKTPDAEQEGVLVVRGDSKAYVTFPSGKPG